MKPDLDEASVKPDAQIAFDVMLKALQQVRRDPKNAKLASKTREVVDEALAAAE